MSIDGLVRRLRRTASRVMIDSCIVSRGDATPIFDPTTGGYTLDPAAEIYVGPCLVPPVTKLDLRSVQAGDTERGLTRYRVLVDHSATGIQKGDVVTLTACRHDPELVGRPLAVDMLSRDSVNVLQTLHAEDAA